ncbi:unnamed protein product [Bursaphelenchus xylophilus]|uniref:(pine wood nematode) hypothetical protein n=1 Tax=Bursaphelenchus xylophilus TaxID=6326 RepID=A0A1I7SUX5_BURXY|nr:unnamed protein product [Bursaphelenchus xylophilus]CAG9125779.1 unnamed protein product [Bursaphelenchus xylophilus]
MMVLLAKLRSRMSAGVKHVGVRPDSDLLARTAKSASLDGMSDQPQDPTVYMMICLFADILIWTLAGIILYRAVKACKQSSRDQGELETRYARFDGEDVVGDYSEDEIEISEDEDDVRRSVEERASFNFFPNIYPTSLKRMEEGKAVLMSLMPMRDVNVDSECKMSRLQRFWQRLRRGSKTHTVPIVTTLQNQHGAEYV